MNLKPYEEFETARYRSSFFSVTLRVFYLALLISGAAVALLIVLAPAPVPNSATPTSPVVPTGEKAPNQSPQQRPVIHHD